MKCRKCGIGVIKASERGAFLQRVNEFGVKGVWECSPTCDHLHGNQDDAILSCLDAQVKSNQKFKDKDDQIKYLWRLLDDISTAGDMFKPERTPYFEYVNRKCEDRSNVANSFDGQTLDIVSCEKV